MPTVIALDVSLSMCRPIPTAQFLDLDKTDKPPPSTKMTPEEEKIVTRKKLGIETINKFLDHVAVHCKLEFVSLVTFSQLYEVSVGFTRDLDTIRTKLKSVPDLDRTNFESMINGITSVVQEAWGSTIPVQILVVTDGSGGFGSGSLKDVLRKAKPFPFVAKMNILCLSDPEEKCHTENCQMLQKLIELTCGGEGMVYFPENHLTSKGCGSAIAKLCSKDFTPYKGTLRCGQLTSKITLCPPPQPFVCRSDEKRYDISDIVDIIGFVDTNDLSSPPAHSRHLMLPLKTNDTIDPVSKSEEPAEEDTDGKVANFCVLLHGALKVENMCAFCEVGQDWYGFIYSWADSKKKSNLMLSILPPGTDIVPWLGNLHQIGPKNELQVKSGDIPSFPVKPADKKSYSSNSTVWLTAAGLNSDIQKLIRLSKKLPEKHAQFFKDLNRMRRWALALGFEQVLETLAQVLERECMLSSTTSPEGSIMMTHAAQQLRLGGSYNVSITAPNVSASANGKSTKT